MFRRPIQSETEQQNARWPKFGASVDGVGAERSRDIFLLFTGLEDAEYAGRRDREFHFSGAPTGFEFFVFNLFFIENEDLAGGREWDREGDRRD